MDVQTEDAPPDRTAPDRMRVGRLYRCVRSAERCREGLAVFLEERGRIVWLCRTPFATGPDHDPDLLFEELPAGASVRLVQEAAGADHG